MTDGTGSGSTSLSACSGRAKFQDERYFAEVAVQLLQEGSESGQG